jgi:hypothetical protein
VLIDALGEIKDVRERESLTMEIVAWADANQGLGCLLALRNYDWDWARALLGSFTPLEMETLTPGKAGQLVEMWLKALGHTAAHATKDSDTFRQELWRRPGIRRFIEQPFFVKKALELWLEHEPIPATRSGLLRDHFRMQFKKLHGHSQSRGFAVMGGEQDHFEFLGELGWVIMDSPFGGVARASVESLWHTFAVRRGWDGMEKEGAVLFDQLVEGGFLTKDVVGRWNFSERVVTEWLGISHLVRTYQEEDRGTFAGLCQKLMGSRSNDPSRLHWLESLCGWLDGMRSEVLLRPMANRHVMDLAPGMVMAAAKCLGEVRTRGACRGFDEDFRGLLEGMTSYVKPEKFTVLPGLTGREHPVTLWQAERVREDAVKMRASLWLAKPETPEWLETLLRNQDADVLARIAAMDSFTRLFPQIAEEKDILRDVMKNETNPLMRRSALQLMVSSQAEPPAHVAVVLKEQITLEPVPVVRGSALRELAMAFRKPETLQFIAAAGGNDPSPVVRRAAFESAIDYFVEYPETVEFISSRAMSDGDFLIRRDTMANLKSRFGNHPLTISAFFDRVAEDESYAIRSYAYNYLKDVAADDTRFREMLIKRGAEEQVNVLRKNILATVAKLRGAEIATYLKERLAQEKDLYVQSALKDMIAARRGK